MRHNSLLQVALVLALAACTAVPATPSAVPVTGDGTPSSQVEVNPQAGQVQANGITIAYESFGSPNAESETILLIGGTGQQLVGWPLELVTSLVERGYHVVRFDNRDVGLSTKLTEAGLPDPAAVNKALQEGQPAPIPYTLRDMAADTVGLLDALDIERVHLVGASMGGAIAHWVAIDHPERVLSLTTIASDSGNPQLPAIANPEAFAGVPPQPTTGDRDAFINWQVKTGQVLAGPVYPTDEATLREWAERDFDRGFDPDGLVRQQTAILVDHYAPSAERWNKLTEINVPTVIIQGTEDPLVPMVSAEDLAARIPNAELRVIPGLGHFIPAELITEIVDAILAAARWDMEPATPGSGLLNTSWQLQSFGPVGATTPVVAGSAITLTFEENGQISGESGCNFYRGSYSESGAALEFEEITGTLKACEDQIMEQEQQYLQALRSASRFTIEGDSLTIWYQEEGGVLNFTRITAPTPASPGEPAERVVFEPGTTSAQFSGLLPSGLGVKQYVLAAQAGQIMNLELKSKEVPISLTIISPSGVQRFPEVVPAEDGYVVTHTFPLPESGDYQITLSKAEQTPSTNYTLDIVIE